MWPLWPTETTCTHCFVPQFPQGKSIRLESALDGCWRLHWINTFKTLNIVSSDAGSMPRFVKEMTAHCSFPCELYTALADDYRVCERVPPCSQQVTSDSWIAKQFPLTPKEWNSAIRKSKTESGMLGSYKVLEIMPRWWCHRNTQESE